MTASAIEIPFEQHRLENGLNVILHQDTSLPRVVLNLWYDVGSKDEAIGRSGFAHLFEHLMFMGTTRLPHGGFDELMESNGGWNNAWTSEDATDYYDVGPSHLVETLIWLEADRMEGLGKAMTQGKLDLQRAVVRNERRQTLEDAPYGEVWLTLPSLMYPTGHPYSHPVIGSHEDLIAANISDVMTFFETWYVPNNASLVIAGDFDPAKVMPFVTQCFGTMAHSKLPDRGVVPHPKLPVTSHKTLIDTRAEVPLSVMAWHTATVFTKEDAAFDLVGALLSEGRSSRLYKRLVRSGLALEVDATQHSQKLSSLFLIEAKPTETHTLEQIEDIIFEELDDLATAGPTSEEMQRVTNQFEVSFIRGMESLQGRASRLNRYHTITGEPGFLQNDLDRYRKTTTDDIQHAARTLSRTRVGRIHVYPPSQTP